LAVLITGASGLVGTSLIDCLKARGEDLICQSRSEHEGSQGETWIKHDLFGDSWDILARYEITKVFYLAGQTSVYAAKADPLSDLRDNVSGLVRLLDYFRSSETRPFFVYAATATQIGLVDTLPITEEMPDNPITFYDLSKLTAERYLLQYVRDGFARGCSLRLANIYGRKAAGQSRDRGILDKVFAKALNGEKISVFGPGDYLRDYLFIDDLISALCLAAENPEHTNGRRFNLGTGKGTTLRDAFLTVANLAKSISGHEPFMEHVEPPAELSPIEFRQAIFDTTEFRKATGWTAKYDFASGVAEAYRTTVHPVSK
jgi:nucleoside-diphosphate-sugar epimerase